jgi:hypothetical protein
MLAMPYKAASSMPPTTYLNLAGFPRNVGRHISNRSISSFHFEMLGDGSSRLECFQFIQRARPILVQQS